MIITTERLFIRPAQTDDWRAVQEIWIDFGRSEYAGYDRHGSTEDQAVRHRVEQWTHADGITEMFLAVCLSGTVIGYISLHGDGQTYEIGYCFHSGYHRHGYAKESISAVLDELGRRGADRILAGTAAANIPSVRLLESLGFTRIGTQRVSFYKDSNGNDIFFEGGVFLKEL